MAREINLNHICKIEGHAHLHLKIEKNKVQECQLKAAEGARFFEALVLGKKVEDIQEVVSRICGICSCSHSVASIQALEEALKIKPTQEQKFIREILLLGERIRSHTTHLYFMSLPDYYNASSALTLPKEHKPKIMQALKIITLGNKIVEEFGGREMHPFLHLKQAQPETNYQELISHLEQTKPFIIKTIKLFSSLKFSDLNRTTEYLSLHEENIYANISGKIYAGKDTFIDNNYKTHLKENIKEYATSKFVLHDKDSFLVGSLARLNNNYNQLDKETKQEFQKLNLKLPLTNPHHNLIAQSLETLNATNRVIELLQSPPIANNQQPTTSSKAGTGVSAVEAPRGTLFHEYKVNKKGIIEYCNIITPTAQNLNQIESDIILLVNKLLEEKISKEKIVKEIEKLIRAYDPCFSCSTHFLKVTWT